MKKTYLSVKARFRDYTYTAELDEKQGLVKITAGCRLWKTFDQAFDHYQTFWTWTDDNLLHHLKTDNNPGMYALYWSFREDARTTLRLLQDKVDEYRKKHVAATTDLTVDVKSSSSPGWPSRPSK